MNKTNSGSSKKCLSLTESQLNGAICYFCKFVIIQSDTFSVGFPNRFLLNTHTHTHTHTHTVTHTSKQTITPFLATSLNIYTNKHTTVHKKGEREGGREVESKRKNSICQDLLSKCEFNGCGFSYWPAAKTLWFNDRCNCYAPYPPKNAWNLCVCDVCVCVCVKRKRERETDKKRDRETYRHTERETTDIEYIRKKGNKNLGRVGEQQRQTE